MEMKSYKISEVSGASDGAGIYAWYAVTNLGPADWKMDIGSDGEDLGLKRYRDALSRHSRRFCPPPMSAELKTAFRDGWSGYLEPLVFNEHVDALSSTTEGSKTSFTYPARSIDKTLGTANQRAQLNNLIVASTPIFSAPLYIGKSGCLRDRLTAHVSALSKFSDTVAKNPEFQEKIRRKVVDPTSKEIDPDINFAMRAVAAGFAPDHLRVYTLEIEAASGLKGESALAAAETLEWLLNTWTRPILGRE
jgi:hypothetical protein